MRFIFIGSNGIRAGWRFAMFLAMTVAMAWGFATIEHHFRYTSQQHGLQSIAPSSGFFTDLPLFVILLVAAFVMSRIERAPMGDYGLPLRGAFGGRFWTGALTGWLSITVVLCIIVAARGGVIFPPATISTQLIWAGAVFILTFVFVGLFEEFLFRGYLQRTLSQGLGFWPAALILSVLFAAAHLRDTGETPAGIAQVVIFALVFCYVLRVTGNLWFAVGYHTAWDWSETFLYGVPDSGQPSSISAFHGVLSGPAWLTGGRDGPEASILALLALLALVPLVSFLYGRRRATG